MFKGSVVAMVTPMLDDKVDVRRLQELVEFHIASGTHAIVAAGTTGEAGSLSRDEKLLVIKTVIDQARERIPIIAGTAANATKDTIMLSQMALELGVHALLIMTPYYIKPTQEGLYQHFSQIAHAVPIPIILYNVPSRTGCDLLPETVARLACISNIVGIKEATGQMCRLQDILHASQGSIDVYSGDDLTAAEWLMAGAKAVISVTANVAPILLAKMCDAALDQDRVTCLSIHEELRSLSELMFCESNPIPVKWALHKMGMMSDEIRLPMTHLSTEYHQKLHQVMVKLHLL